MAPRGVRAAVVNWMCALPGLGALWVPGTTDVMRLVAEARQTSDLIVGTSQLPKNATQAGLTAPRLNYVNLLPGVASASGSAPVLGTPLAEGAVGSGAVDMGA